MADGAVIGALRVVLGADTADFDKGLKNSQAGLASFGATVGAGLAAVAAAAAAAAVAVGVALGRTIDDMDKLNKTSQKLGIPVEQLSSLAYAADLADVSFEALSKGVGKLSKTMVEAAAKPTSEAANAFRALGVSVTDSNGKLKSSDTVLADVADKFAGLKDGAGKTAVSMAIFGKAGADMIPLLNGGRDSLKEMNEEAKTFGAIVSTGAAKQAEAFNDNLTRLGYAVKGVFVQVATALLPILVDVSTKMVNAAKNSSVLELVINALSASMKGLVTAGVLVSSTMQVAGDALSIIWGGLARLIKGDISGAFEHLKTKSGDIATTASATLATVQGLWNGQKAGAEGAAVSTDKAVVAQKEFNFAAMGGKNAIDLLIESQTKGLASQEAEIATFGMATGAKAALTLQLQALSLATQNHTTISAAQQAQLNLTKQKIVENSQALAALQLKQSNLTPAQLFQKEQTNIETLFKSGELTVEEYEAAMEKAAERVGATWANAVASMSGGFQDLANAFSKNNKTMAIAGKAFGVVQATINTYTGFTAALASGPPPFNYILAAGVLAAGMAKVMAISSQSTAGLAMGGAFRVPGGVGGGDKVPFNAMLEPGEMVEVSSNRAGGYQSGGGQRGGAPIDLSGVIPLDDWIGMKGRDLVRIINDAIGDGGRLRTA